MLVVSPFYFLGVLRRSSFLPETHRFSILLVKS